ncbi:MAG: amidohydrolase family protein [Spirochaetes bacterium]|nr:amidohydrolase family protein [Spirochaetota bacterium]
MARLLLKDGFVVFPDKIRKVDLLLKDKKIESIKPSLDRNQANIISVRDRYILPGGIDVHTHMELKVKNNMVCSDDFYTGSKAALKGGITTFFGFAYQDKKETLLKAYRRTYKSALKKSQCSFRLHAGILNVEMNIEKQIAQCITKGVRTFKVHLNDPDVDSGFLLRIFKIISRYKGILLVHCEDGKIVQHNTSEYVRSNKKQIRFYPQTRKNFVETISIDLVIQLAREFGTRIYIVHVTTREGLMSIERAKKEESLWVEAETTPHYLLLNESLYRKDQSYLNTCTPPFRSTSDNKALWEGLKKGIIKVVSTDHCPFLKEQKARGMDDFTKLPYGIGGIETLYPLMLSEGTKRAMNYSQISNLISYNPSKIFNLYPLKGVIRPGSIADLVIYNPKQSYRLTKNDLVSHCDHSPYEGWKINGKIEKVIFEGRIISTQ